MGNCGIKNKDGVNVCNPQEKTRVTVLRINKGIHCPRCNIFFEVNTPFLTVNSHIEVCVLTNNDNTMFGSNHEHPDPIAIDSKSKLKTPRPKYIWIKDVDANNKIIWKKIVSTSEMTVDHLENMTLDSAIELPFEDKKKWFKLQMDKIRIPWVCGADHLHISHKNVVEGALNGINQVNLHKEVKIVFEEEKNVNDAGGLMREFIYLICQELFKAETGLFCTAETEEVTYSINPRREDTMSAFMLYNLLGRVLGKAIFEQMSIPVQFDRLFLKQIIDEDFSIDDLASIDTQLYNSLKFIKENPIDGSDVFEEYFVVQSPFDRTEVELIPNGRETKICDANKDEYIRLMLNWMGRDSVSAKSKVLLDAIFQVVPKNIFSVFTIEEVEMVLYGLPFIDVNDWESNTSYKGSYYRKHQIIRWFWESMRELDQPQLSKFFYFCTGSTRPPVEGFNALQSNRGEIQKFTIESIKMNDENLSLKAHTCFNRLDLPMYQSKEDVKDAVHIVLNMDFCGVFGLE